MVSPHITFVAVTLRSSGRADKVNRRFRYLSVERHGPAPGPRSCVQERRSTSSLPTSPKPDHACRPGRVSWSVGRYTKSRRSEPAALSLLELLAVGAHFGNRDALAGPAAVAGCTPCGSIDQLTGIGHRYTNLSVVHGRDFAVAAISVIVSLALAAAPSRCWKATWCLPTSSASSSQSPPAAFST